MDGMKAVRLPRDRPHRTRVPQDRVRRQRHRSREPGYPRKSNLPGIQEIAWLVRDPCPQQSASSDPPANHSRDSHETRRFYTVWVKLRKAHCEQMSSGLPPIADMNEPCRHFAFVPQPDSCTAAKEAHRLAQSINSSASNCIELGTSRPSARAVCRLMTNSSLVGCKTGKSAGFAPLRI